MDPNRCAALPERGVPQQFQDCAMQFDHVDNLEPKRAGPASLAYGMDGPTCGQNDSDVEEEDIGVG